MATQEEITKYACYTGAAVAVATCLTTCKATYPHEDLFFWTIPAVFFGGVGCVVGYYVGEGINWFLKVQRSHAEYVRSETRIASSQEGSPLVAPMRIGLKPSQPVYDPLSHATKEDKASAKAIISSGGHDALRNLLVWAIGLVTVFLEFGVLIMTFRLGILSGNSAEGLSLLAFFGAWAAAYLGGKFVIMPAQFRRVLREVIVKRLAKVSESEVARLTESEAECERIYQRQSAALVAQTQLYRKIESQIENAEGLFRERAFTPFWENVDQCIAALHGLESKTKQVHEDARKYFELLAERPHTFPDFPISAGQMPAADGLVGHLSVIVRSAQKDFQFASIYEQRRTTRAVTMGFRNINEVITDLGRALASSVAEFNNSIAAHTERFEEKAASDAAHQEVVEAALNELQKPRKQRR